MITKGEYPNMTLESYREFVSKLQRKLDSILNQKYHAQSVAFDLMFPEKKAGDIETIKANAFYWGEELKKAVVRRDKMSQELQEAKAEITLLKTKLKKYGMIKKE